MFDDTRAKSLEDMFFYEKERSLIEARHKLEQMKETKENLAKVSGIKDEAVLEKLVKLEIRPEALATLFAVPLVEIAWADGELHPHERDALFSFARKAGFRKTEIDPALLSIWLKHKPDPALLEAWEDYTRALCRELSDSERHALKAEVMADARMVAESAGGFLGFHKTSSQEEKMLARLAAAFGA
jgi:tellurite resistance protein